MTATSTYIWNVDCFPEPEENPHEEICFPEPGPDEIRDMLTVMGSADGCDLESGGAGGSNDLGNCTYDPSGKTGNLGYQV